LVIAITIPASTNTTMRTWVHTHSFGIPMYPKVSSLSCRSR
jgi:hypothetical protein